MFAAIGWATITSWIPRTSPTFQSRFGLSGWELWQVTQTWPIFTGATARTLRSKIEPETSTILWSGVLRAYCLLLELIQLVSFAASERHVRDKPILN